jgi:hypothetical protein
MANLKLKNPSGGSLALVSADGASDLTVTFPAATGTAMVSGNMPAFSAYITTQTVSGDTATKMQFATENFDTNNNFDSTTNYRFTPTVAGYYLVTASSYFSSYSGGSFVNLTIYKNGTPFQEVQRTWPSTNPSNIGGSVIVFCNGSTDYIEAYWYSAGGSSVLVNNNGSALSHFDACLLRGQ